MSTPQGSAAAGDSSDPASGADDRAGDRAGGGSGGGRRAAGAFDIRIFIGSLIGAYGLVLVLMGLFSTSDTDLERAGGINVNLWAGLGMVAVAAVLFAWARLRPVIVPADPDTDAGEQQPSGATPGGSPDTR